MAVDRAQEMWDLLLIDDCEVFEFVVCGFWKWIVWRTFVFDLGTGTETLCCAVCSYTYVSY